VTEPLVSILLLSYNQVPFLAEAIESALAQTWRPLEVVVVDNGSTDGSADVLERYAPKATVTVSRHEHNGPITTRMNEAVRTARGTWVSFLFSDDLYEPEKIEHQVRAAVAASPAVGVVYGPTLVEDVHSGARTLCQGLAADGLVFEPLMREVTHPIEMISALIDRQALLRHPFHEDLFTEGEGIFWRLALEERFLFVDLPLAVSRQHGSNMGKAIIRNRDWGLRLHDKLRAEPGLTSDQRDLVDTHEALSLRGFAWQGARLGADPAWVRNCLRRAAAQDVRVLSHPRAVAAAALALAPPRLASFVNRLANRGAPIHQRTIVDNYAGYVGRG